VTFAAPPARWDPPYAVEEFMPQEPEVLLRLAEHLARVQVLLGQVDSLLRDGSAPSLLRAAVEAMALLAGEAASAAGIRVAEVEATQALATRVVASLNQAQARGPAGRQDFDPAYAAALDCTRQGVHTLADLEQALDQVDRELVELDLADAAGADRGPLDRVREGLVEPGPAEARTVLAQLAEREPSEIRFVLDHVPEDDLAGLLGDLDPVADAAVFDALARALPAQLYRRLADTDPHSFWNPPTGDGSLAWAVPLGVTPGTVPDADIVHLDQMHRLGTCAVLSCLGAVEARRPGWLASRVRPHANGTYDVELYREGTPFEVVGTPELPALLDAAGRPLRQVYPVDEPDIYDLFEKALAMVWGAFDPQGNGVPGFAGMNGVAPSRIRNVLAIVTGRPADFVLTQDLEADRLRSAVREGRPATVSSLLGEEVAAHRLYQPGRRLNRMHGQHEYFVLDCRGDGPQPLVVLGNPWGLRHPEAGTVELPWAEFVSATHDVTIGR
jgi:hypothetical protein